MALQSSGAISLADIAGEFGGSPPHSISEYYGSGGAPGSGTISFSDFYGLSNYSGPPSVSMWVVGGGGGGGSATGTGAVGAGGGGSAGQVLTATSGTISSGDTFSIMVAAGRPKDQNGLNTTLTHNGTTYTGEGGGRGGASSNGFGHSSIDPLRGGGGAGLISLMSMAGAAGVSGKIGAGGDGLVNSGEVGGGGGGSGYLSGSNSNIDATVNALSQFVAGRGQYGLNFTQGVPSTIMLGYGGSGGVSQGVVHSNGGSGSINRPGQTGQGYGGGGGGGAYNRNGTPSLSTQDGGTGSNGVVIIQYSSSYSAPTSVTGTHYAYNQGGYRTYVCYNSLTWGTYNTITW